jgi:hypothetical protein
VIFLVANFCYCQKYFGKRIFCHKFFVHFFKMAKNKIKSPQLPTIWKGCLRFSTTIFFILPNSAKYTYGWMIATWATLQKLGEKKTLLLPELKHLWLPLRGWSPKCCLGSSRCYRVWTKGL